MRLTAQEEYGLRCLLQLARRPICDPVGVGEIASAEGISEEYAGKLLRVLRDAELVRSVRGKHGGYHLVRPAREITVWDALCALDQPLYTEQFCLTHSGQGHTCVHTPSCSMRSLWGSIGALLEACLAAVTIDDLAHGRASVDVLRAALQSASAPSDAALSVAPVAAR